MALYEGPRQILAGILAGAVFLALFFGMQLVWWLALILGAVAYAAFLLIIPRRYRPEEIVLRAHVSQTDMQNAGAALKGHALRLDRLLRSLPDQDRPAIENMSAHLMSIRDNVLKDPDDYRLTRRFITTYLPNMVRTVESYAQLAGQGSGDQSDRIATLGQQIREFGAVIEDIDRACIENDLAALEAEVDALGTQLSRRLR